MGKGKTMRKFVEEESVQDARLFLEKEGLDILYETILSMDDVSGKFLVALTESGHFDFDELDEYLDVWNKMHNVRFVSIAKNIIREYERNNSRNKD